METESEQQAAAICPGANMSRLITVIITRMSIPDNRADWGEKKKKGSLERSAKTDILQDIKTELERVSLF